MTSSVSLSTSAPNTGGLSASQNRNSGSADSVKQPNQESKALSIPHGYAASRLLQRTFGIEIYFKGRTRRSESLSVQLAMQERKQLLDRLRLTLRGDRLDNDLHGATKRLSESIAGLLDKLMIAEVYFREPAGTTSLPASFWSDLSRDTSRLVNSIQEEISAGKYVGSQPDLFREFGRILSELTRNMRQFNRTFENRHFPNRSTEIGRSINENMRKLGNDISGLRDSMQKSWTLCKVEKVLLGAELDLLRNSQNFLNSETSKLN